MNNSRRIEARSPRHRILGLVCYLGPLLLLGLVYLPINAGSYVFWRNWSRAGCGPVVKAMGWARFDPNDLSTYLVAFAVRWLAWFILLYLSPLNRMP
jgi:hypothetical protein